MRSRSHQAQSMQPLMPLSATMRCRLQPRLEAACTANAARVITRCSVVYLLLVCAVRGKPSGYPAVRVPRWRNISLELQQLRKVREAQSTQLARPFEVKTPAEFLKELLSQLITKHQRSAFLLILRSMNAEGDNGFCHQLPSAVHLTLALARLCAT